MAQETNASEDVGGQFHVSEDAYTPVEWTFEGYCTTEEMRVQLEAWADLNRRWYLHDHRGRAWKVTFGSLELTPRLTQNWNGEWTNEGHAYKATVLVVDRDSTEMPWGSCRERRALDLHRHADERVLHRRAQPEHRGQLPFPKSYEFAQAGPGPRHPRPLLPGRRTFGGVVRSQTHHDALIGWQRRPGKVQITDHLGRTFELMIRGLEMTDRRPNGDNTWRLQYQFNCLLLRRTA